MQNMSNMVVAIDCMTYNHELYIRDCLEGFVMQKTNFKFVAIVHDDASTDGTATIIKEYAEKYPDIIKPILETENQYSKKDGSIQRIMSDAINATGSKYVAMCEGDDYWIDPYKLQKQVDFMEANPDCSVTFHRYRIYDEENNSWRDDRCSIYLNNEQEFVRISVEEFLNNWVTQPVTMVFRNNLNLGNHIPYRLRRDQHLIYHLLKEGNGYILNFEAAVYREHKGGIHSKTSLVNQCKVAVIIASELFKFNGTDILKRNYINNLDWAIETFIQNKEDKLLCFKFIIKRFVLSFSLKRLIKQFIKFVI